jgi:hypothetical protein
MGSGCGDASGRALPTSLGAAGGVTSRLAGTLPLQRSPHGPRVVDEGPAGPRLPCGGVRTVLATVNQGDPSQGDAVMVAEIQFMSCTHCPRVIFTLHPSIILSYSGIPPSLLF